MPFLKNIASESVCKKAILIGVFSPVNRIYNLSEFDTKHQHKSIGFENNKFHRASYVEKNVQIAFN